MNGSKSAALSRRESPVVRSESEIQDYVIRESIQQSR